MPDIRANINTIEFPKTYSGEVLDYLLTLTAQGNDTYKKGLIHVETDVTYALTLPTATIGKVIQDDVPTPDYDAGSAGADGFNTIEITERQLEPQKFMVLLRWNPEDMASYWRPFKPRKNMLFRELDADVQADFINLVLESKNTEIGEAIWLGVKGGKAKLPAKFTLPTGGQELGVGKANSKFDGVMSRIITASLPEAKGVDKINVVGTGLLDTGEAVAKAFEAIHESVSDALRSHMPDMTYAVSWSTWIKYDRWMTNKDVKYSDNSEENRRRFKGVNIVPVHGCPEHTILLAKLNTSPTSNLWMSLDWTYPTTDERTFKIDSWSNSSSEKFIQMRMKMDVNIVKPCEMYVHTAYAKGLNDSGTEEEG